MTPAEPFRNYMAHIMNVRLLCSDDHRPILEELLHSCGMTVTAESASLVVCEQGMDSGPAPLKIVFDPGRLSLLEDLFSGRNAFRAEDAAAETSGEILLGRKGECFELMRVSDICYFRADGDYVFSVSEQGEFEVKKKLYQLEKIYRDRGFIRISKSLIVNILVVSEVVPWFGGRLLLRIARLEDKVEVSRNYVGAFKNYLGM